LLKQEIGIAKGGCILFKYIPFVGVKRGDYYEDGDGKIFLKRQINYSQLSHGVIL
jgi:hypothetical protein